MNRLFIGRAAACLLLIPIAAGAADAVGPSRDAAPSSTLEAIVVTGSYIRRTDTESPSPVDIINADDITKRGLTSIADVLHSLSSDNSGTLT